MSYEQEAFGHLRQSLQPLNEASSTVKRNFSVGGFQMDTVQDPVAYEVSLPDIHYGKYTGQTLDDAEEEYMNTVKDLVAKADGLNIERIVLPIGNDGMNSEGYSRATTKGTPQQDSAEWQETFVGYCNLMVRAIHYLAKSAPVDVVIV